MKQILAGWVLAVLVFGNAGNYASRADEGQADIIYMNGRFATFDAADSVVDAVAVKDAKFLKVGSMGDVSQVAGPATRMVDLGGRTVVPGFIDAHCHPMETIMMKESWVDGRYPGCASVAQVLSNITAWVQHTPTGVWVFVACSSASENKFAEKRLPTKAELDAVAPANPVVLANGAHMAVINARALAALGITNGVSKLPHGGSAILDAQGEPTGVIADGQADFPTIPSVADLEKYYTRDIQAFWNAYGFTTVMAITPAAANPLLQKIAASGFQPTLRYVTALWTSANDKEMPADLAPFELPATARDWFRFFGIKDWVDGENDCRTGLMYESYEGHQDTDPAGGKGTLVTPQPQADGIVQLAAKAGKASLLHCSGDQAMDIGLAACESVGQAGATATLMRIEHFGVFQMSDAQLQRAAALKKAAPFHISVQPTWLSELVKADRENMGVPLADSGFRFRAMIDAGLEPAAGTDMTGIYLGNINPFTAIYASVTRNSDAGIFMPDQAVTVKEALRMWTVWAARSVGLLDVAGTIEPGKYADMAVLSDDVFNIPPEDLKTIKVLQTIVGGNPVYSAGPQ